MLSQILLYIAGVGAYQTAYKRDSGCAAQQVTTDIYSSTFHQPQPPKVTADFETSFIQHKWNQDLSHITAGYMYFKPAQGTVRVDQAFEDNLATSTFNYANVTKDGLVDNTLTTYANGTGEKTTWRGYVNSDFPLFPEDLLISSSAVFGGRVQRPLLNHEVSSWSILYLNTIPATVYVDDCNVVVGYDYFSPNERTYVTTSFFNTAVGKGTASKA